MPKLIDIMKLKREQDSIKKEMKSLCDAGLSRSDKRMTEAEGIKYIELEKLKEDIEGQIVTAERSNKLQMEEQDNNNDDSQDSGAGDHKDEKRSGGFSGFGDMLIAVKRAYTHGELDKRLVSGEKRAATGMNEAIPSDGGYLVQPEHLKEIQRRIFEKSVIASRCSKLQIGANSNGITWPELDETSRKDGFRHGGVRAYWAAEAGTVSASYPKLGKKHLDLEKLMAFVYTTDELLSDATALESYVSGIVDDELSFQLDEAILEGSGAGKPLGLINSAATITIPKEVGQASGSIVFENLLKMRSRLWARSRANSVWFINQDCEPELSTMAFVVGAGGVPVYLPAAGVSVAPYDTLYSRPVIPIEHAETVGTVGDIWLADMSQYRLIDKGGISQASSMHVKFLTDEHVFRFIYRVNGTPLWSTALTPKKGTNTQSPYINLATRS